MLETSIVLTPLHYCYLIGVIVILGVMILRKDTPAVCIGFLFLLGLTGLGSVWGGIQTVFNAILYAGREFMEIIATIALVTALSKCLRELGKRLSVNEAYVPHYENAVSDLVDIRNYHAHRFSVFMALSICGPGRCHYASLFLSAQALPHWQLLWL